MRVPLPCNFGEIPEMLKTDRILAGVDWFHWANGMQYTYYLAKPGAGEMEQGRTDLYSSDGDRMSCSINIPDRLLVDQPIRDHGFPLRGTGYLFGLSYKAGLLYADLILTSRSLAHVYVQCDENIQYIPDGKILLPPSWDTPEKRTRAVAKSFRMNA